MRTSRWSFAFLILRPAIPKEEKMLRLPEKHAILFTGFLAAPWASGFVQPKHTDSLHLKSGQRLPIQQKTLRVDTSIAPQNLHNKKGDANQIRIDRHSQAIRLVAGHLEVASIPKEDLFNTNAYIKLAKDYVDQNPQLFAIPSSQLQVVDKAILIDKDVQFIKFAVKRNGLRIEDAGIDFRFKRGQLVQIANQSFGEAKVASDKIQANLEKMAANLVPGFQLERGADSYRVDKTATGYQLIRVANFEVEGASGQHLGLQVHTETGKLFELKDHHYHLDNVEEDTQPEAEVLAGQASVDVYPRWFDQGLVRMPYSFAKLDTAQEPVWTNLGGLFSAKQNANPNIDGLMGTFVKVQVRSGTRIARDAAIEDGQWALSIDRQDEDDAWLDKETAQSMIYYHTTDIINEAKRFISSPWFDEQLVANANLRSTCNAHWDGSTINFYSGGSGCSNTGLISDVIFHEWGHGLDHNTGGIEDGAFSEGFGDIMSLIMTRSHKLGIGFRVPSMEPVRDLAPDKIYPQDRGGVHAEGLIIGSTFWDLFEALSGKMGEEAAVELLKNYAFKMIFTARTYLDVYDALLVIDDNDNDLANGTPNKCLLNEIFHKHGLTERFNGCILASIDTFHIDDSDADSVIEPGESVRIGVTVTNNGDATVSGLTGTLSVSDSSKIQVVQPHLDWDDVQTGESKQSRKWGELKVIPNAACGSSFTAKLRIAADEREVITNQTFILGRNAGLATAFAATGLPMDIKDNQTTSATMQVGGDQWRESTTIAKARLAFDISHTYIGDLKVFLINPEGTRIEVFAGSGSGDDVQFDQDISHLIEGQLGQGEWFIAVQDSASRDEGTLNSASLTLTPAHYVCD